MLAAVWMNPQPPFCLLPAEVCRPCSAPPLRAQRTQLQLHSPVSELNIMAKLPQKIRSVLICRCRLIPSREWELELLTIPGKKQPPEFFPIIHFPAIPLFSSNPPEQWFYHPFLLIPPDTTRLSPFLLTLFNNTASCENLPMYRAKKWGLLVSPTISVWFLSFLASPWGSVTAKCKAQWSFPETSVLGTSRNKEKSKNREFFHLHPEKFLIPIFACSPYNRRLTVSLSGAFVYL